MCGIAGVAAIEGLDAEHYLPGLHRALNGLAGRGPDGEGIWRDEHCLLGHRRLAIVDLSDAGAQPMVREGLALTFNGMIYNFRALRQELAARGHSFRSETDSEVLLEGWRAWGPDLLPRLEGMFAFALWDAGARTLFLARDRFGKKPLLYRAEDRQIAFASTLRGLQKLEANAGEIDPEALRLYFALRYVPEPRAILKGVAKVPPGGWVKLDGSGLSVGQWADPDADCSEVPASEADAARQLRSTVETAVADRLVADVPLGVFLSGGIDSAIVAASMAKAAGTVRSFTVGFEGVADYYEERPAAAEVARHIGSDHTPIEVSAASALDAIDDVLAAQDEPFADSSAIPTWIVSRETRRHVTVSLSGDGADELFGGYRKYQGELYAARYQALPGVLRRGLIEPAVRALPAGKDRPLLEKIRRAQRFTAHAGAPAAERYGGLARLLQDRELDRLLGPAGRGETPEGLYGAALDRHAALDPVSRMLAAEADIGLAGDMLVKVDRMSASQGLEVRCPFLDSRVAALARALPGTWKLKRGAGKAILRTAFADALPADVFTRPKKGFEIPIATWMRGPLRARVADAASPERLRRQGLVDPDLPQMWLRDLDRGRDTSWQLWALTAFQHWLDGQDGIASNETVAPA